MLVMTSAFCFTKLLMPKSIMLEDLFLSSVQYIFYCRRDDSSAHEREHEKFYMDLLCMVDNICKIVNQVN